MLCLLIIVALISCVICEEPHHPPADRLNKGLNMFVNTNDDDLLSLLKEASGVYRKPQELTPREKAFNLDKTIVITAVNHGFLDFFYNFDCFMQRLNFKYLVLAMDSKAYKALQTHPEILAYHLQRSHSSLVEDNQHVMLLKLKFAFVLKIMNMGYNVLFSDIDVAIIRNPLPYLLWKNVDYVFSSDAFCNKANVWHVWDQTGGNTGFYYVKSTVYTREIFYDTLLTIESNPQWQDQEAFWYLTKENMKKQIIYTYGSCTDHYEIELKQLIDHYYPSSSTQLEKSIVMCSLDPCIFANGLLGHDEPIPDILFDRIDPIVMVHATALSGFHAKQSRLQYFDFWITNVTNTETGKYTCNAFQRRGVKK